MLTGAVASLGSSYELTLTMLETGSGTVVAQVTQRCDVCNFKEVEDAAARAAERLHRQALAVVALRSRVIISSVPPGAEVILDGLPHGPAPVRSLLAPGRHLVEASARGLAPLAAPARAQRRRGAHAQPESASSAATSCRSRRLASRTRYPSWMKWSLLSGGLALLGPGAVLWSVDGRPAADERNLADTRPAGIALVSVGSAALVAGTVLWILERR